jgi:hypothetical protein
VNTTPRAGRWTWTKGHRDGASNEPDGPPVRPASQGRALADALAELSDGVWPDGGAGQDVDLYLDAGGSNAGALLRFADTVDSGKRIRPSYATALEPTQAVVEAISRLGWTGQVVTVVSDARSAPLLPVGLAGADAWTCAHRVVAELRVTEPPEESEFTGTITAVLVRPEDTDRLAGYDTVAAAVDDWTGGR